MKFIKKTIILKLEMEVKTNEKDYNTFNIL